MANSYYTFCLLATIFAVTFARPFTRSNIYSTTVAIQILSNGINPSHVINSTGRNAALAKVINLYSRNSHKFIRINKDNSVDGLGTQSDPHAKLVLESAGFSAQVRIRSFNGTQYLCLSVHGAITVENQQQGSSLDRCVFYQVQHKGYTVYRSKSNNSWYLGIRNNGKTKSAKKTSFTQRATHFLEF